MATPEELQRQNTGGSTDPTNLRAGDDHAGPLVIGANPASIKAGHEPDEVQIKGILIVPAIIVVGFIIAYGTVSILIGMFRQPRTEERNAANQMALKKADAPLEQRLANINAPESKGGVDQPRLEGLKRYEGDEPPYLRSRTGSKKENWNSPEYHPEDLRPDRVDRLTAKENKGYGWVDQGKTAHIPIDRAITLALKEKNVLPIKEHPLDPTMVDAPPSRDGKPSNAGQGIAAPKKEEHKKAEPKKESNEKK